jgi:hypothetical protein
VSLAWKAGMFNSTIKGGMSRSSDEFDVAVVEVATSSRRLPLGLCQSDTRWIESRVLAGSCVIASNANRL